MKKMLIVCLCISGIVFSLFGCKGTQNPQQTMEGLFALLYNCPNETLIAASLDDAVHYGAGVSSVAEPGQSSHAFFADYVAESYLDDFVGVYGIEPHLLADGTGTCSFQSLALTPFENDTASYTFLVSVLCTREAKSETLEIGGSLRLDSAGKLENIKYDNSYSRFYAFFYDIDAAQA